MIIETRPLSLGEVKELATNLDEKSELGEYLKKFSKLGKKESEKLADELRELKNVKLKEENVIKIVDFLPRHGEDLNKIFFNDLSLDEKETNEILEIVKKY